MSDDNMSAADEASLLGDTGDATQGSSVSAPNTPSVSFNPALTTAGAGTLAKSGEGPVQKTPTPTPLVDREGYAVAKSFVDGNMLELPAETFYSRFAPAFETANAPLIKQMGGGAVGELVVEIYQAALYEGEPSTSTDHALTWLKSLVDKKRTENDARTIEMLKQKLAAQVQAGATAAPHVLAIGDSRVTEVAAVKQALASLSSYDGVKHLTQRALEQRKRAVDAALTGHNQVLGDISAVLNAVETTLKKTSLEWSQVWRQSNLGVGSSPTLQDYWTAFSKRFSKPNAEMEHPMQLLTLSPTDGGVNRAAESYVSFVLAVIQREEKAEMHRVKVQGYKGFSEILKRTFFVNAMRPIAKIYKKLMDKQLDSLGQAVDLVRKELSKAEYKDKQEKIKLDLLAYVCTHCSGLHDAQTCKVLGKPRAQLEERRSKQRPPPFQRMAAVVVQALDINEADHDEAANAVVAALQGTYDPNSGQYRQKRKYDGAGRGGGRGGSGRSHGRQQGRGRGGSFRGRGRGRGNHTHGASSFTTKFGSGPQLQQPVLANGEMAAACQSRSDTGEAPANSAPAGQKEP